MSTNPGAIHFLASGVELNAYATDAESDSADAIAGRLYGIQYKSVFDLTDTTQVITGSGYEWVEWDDDTDNESGFTHSLEVRQWVGDELSLFGSGFIGTTETRYGGGLDMSFDTAAATHRLRLEYTHIDGHEGIHDDDRVQGTWSIGFGANSTRRETTDNALTDRSGTIHATATTYTRPHNGRLLDQIMKRSKALPQRSVAKQVSVICGNGNVEPGAPEGAGFRGVSLAHNVREKAEVAALLAEAEAAGGRRNREYLFLHRFGTGRKRGCHSRFERGA